MTGYIATIPPVLEPITITDRIQRMGAKGWPLNKTWLEMHHTTIATSIQNGTAIGVSDGSYKPNISQSLAAAGWLVQDLVSHTALPGVVRVSGTPRETNAYRAKLQGFHAMLLGILVICQHHQITQGKVILGMDNQKGAETSANPFLDPAARIAHVDLVRAI